MAETDQLRTDDHPLPDLDDFDRRLAQVANGLLHIEAILPSMLREVEILRSMRGRVGEAA